MSKNMAQKFEIKLKESFETKLSLYIFAKVRELPAGNRDIPDDIFDVRRFVDFRIDRNLILDYAGRYWQQERNAKIPQCNNKTPDQIYVLMQRAWAKLKYQDRGPEIVEDKYYELLSAYRKDFEGNRDAIADIANQETCHYCGLNNADLEILRNIDHPCLFKKNERGWTMEIDRREPNMEYTRDNLAPSCYWCNNAKTDEFSAEEFKDIIGPAIGLVWAKRMERQLADQKPINASDKLPFDKFYERFKEASQRALKRR